MHVNSNYSIGMRTKDGRAVDVVGVLAGAYRGRDISARTLLSHALVAGDEVSLCRRVPLGNLCDQDLGGEPTCPACAKRLQKIVEKSA